MVQRVVRSVTGVPIRLTGERWAHIADAHAALAGRFEDVLETVTRPDEVVAGRTGEKVAYRGLPDGRHLVVVYREVAPDDGFIITAYLARRLGALKGRPRLWPKP